ncbi:SIT4 phosphatase-associated protein-domain-containing protein [Coniochaeta sp. 2T2.1]|nr:SIT4 phosphatase-associated protein-domain-containing protein [Coniochaeta sp. 2T2.1]
MFWRFGGYANISTIDSILDKPDFTLEELLEESDLVQELKQHNAKLVEYLREQKVLEKLLEYVVAPKLEPVAVPEPEDEDDDENEKGKGLTLSFARSRASSRATDSSAEGETEKKRNRYAFVAAEILSSDNWSIYEAVMESKHLLRDFWQFLKRPAPLDPLQASYFTKVNESLFDKKTEEMIELLKTLDNAVADMIKHVDSPMVMDLLLKIISLERTDSGQGIVEWLYTQDVMPTLLSFLGPEHSWATQTSAGDFMKAIITVSANASQNEQTCIGPNELTRQLVSKPCVEQLIQYMLGGGNALTVGVGIIIEVIRKNNSDYDPEMGAEQNATPSSRDPIYLGTLLRLFADHVPDFMRLIMNAPAQKERLDSTFGGKIEPLGFDRFKTCELMAELLHCSNMGLLNEVGAEELITARDAERQRLRTEGKLQTARGGDGPSSLDELTMRTTHSSSPEESRRLEVTNVSNDEDGFEEVAHAADPDTSDEFVRAEDDIPDLPTLPDAPTHQPGSSFLDKDDDDFVDEPLSSPRLNVQDPEKDGGNNGFEHPDLVVAPLSPTKAKPAEVAAAEKPESDDGPAKAADVPTEGSTSESDKPKEPPSTIPSGTANIEVPVDSGNLGGLSPHPDDTPAPLFSGSPEKKTTPAGGDAAQFETPEETASTEPKESELGDASIIVGHAIEPESSSEEKPMTPVVGDYLKIQFVEYKVVPTILSFFFKYPWNNFLHNVVYDIVQQVFNGPMDRGNNPTLAISLFESADITAQIIQGQLASEESQAKTKTRMGYMGHLTLIAEEVVKFTERHPPEILSETVLDRVMSQEWINYVEGALAETRERDNAILGGVRPEVAMSNRVGATNSLAAGGLSSIGLLSQGGSGGNSQGASSSALADAGLNGSLDHDIGSANGLGPFTVSGGLMSGFGSSSDEDEEEEQENEEDVNNEFRAFTDPFNTSNTSSLQPPSIPPPPPPPPPLNVPPSRARLQLAARLAMHKNKPGGETAASSSTSPPTEGASGNLGPSVNDPSNNSSSSSSFTILQPPPQFTDESHFTDDALRDPFADDEEHDSSGSGSGSDNEGEGEAAPSSSERGYGSGWHRGSWWRGVVRSARGRSGGGRGGESSSGRGNTTERFGDGRDDDSDEENSEGEVGEGLDDEEFGDFAMPEVTPDQTSATGQDKTDAAGGSTETASSPSLVKPLPLHPATNKTSASPFGSLWPFSTQGFGIGGSSAKEKEVEKDEPAKAGEAEITEEPLHVGQGEGEGEGVVDEDGKKIDRAVEAKRRTSIEDPDDDEEGEGEVVGRGGR